MFSEVFYLICSFSDFQTNTVCFYLVADSYLVAHYPTTAILSITLGVYCEIILIKKIKWLG